MQEGNPTVDAESAIRAGHLLELRKYAAEEFERAEADYNLAQSSIESIERVTRPALVKARDAASYRSGQYERQVKLLTVQLAEIGYTDPAPPADNEEGGDRAADL